MIPIDSVPDLSPLPESATDNTPRRFLKIADKFQINLRATLRLSCNKFGLTRRYFGRPDAPIPDATTIQLDGQFPEPAAPAAMIEATTEAAAIAPYPNYSSFLLGDWFWMESELSRGSLRRLVDGVLLHPRFNPTDVGINWRTMHDAVAASVQESDLEIAPPPIGWRRSTISLQVPHGRRHSRVTPTACLFDIKGVLHRPLPDVIRDIFSQPTAINFHYTPYQLSWDSPDGPSENVYHELFSSAAFIQAHEDVQVQHRQRSDCNLPCAVAALMFASDAKHLTQTGSAKINPLNLYIGNQSMYERVKPSNRSVHPVAYFPQVRCSSWSFLVALIRDAAATDGTQRVPAQQDARWTCSTKG